MAARAPSPEAARALAEDLRGEIEGEVRFDSGSRALYSTDASNYRQVPIGVVIPRHVEDVAATVAACRRHGAPVLARGGGTSLAGQCCNVAVVIDFSKYLNRILDLDPERRLARVEPGCILDPLRDAAEAHDLTFGPDPATYDRNTLGGMIGNNSCGVHSVMAGRTADNVETLEVLTYDGLRLRVGATPDDQLEGLCRQGGRIGEIYRRLRRLRDEYAEDIRARYPRIPRRVSGYNLDELLPERGFNVARALVGSEGTCVTVLDADLRLVPSPRLRTLVVLGYPDVYSAADHVPEIMRHGPIGLEGLDDRLTGYMGRKSLHPEHLGLLPEAGGWLLAEFGGDSRGEADARARALVDALGRAEGAPAMRVFSDRAQQKAIWDIRESGLGATARVPGEHDTWPGWEDAAVPPERLGGYLRAFRRLLDEHGYECSLYGHFGDGCVHVRIDFDLATHGGIERYLGFVDKAADLVLRHGGSLSGEHGDGQSRAALLPKMYGERLIAAFREFKAIWDPDGRMNPGKVVDPLPIDANLRLGEWTPPDMDTAFAYTQDDGKFARAATRCVGVGKCRRLGGGVMCPSFMATREEKHSTRGRARLLFEMIEGAPLREGWRSEAVREALDLCLACKGCKRDCPVNVDMATYKAEFFHHYYEGRLRPRSAYSMGLIHRWARLASLAPGIANALLAAPGLGWLAKWAAGIHPERRLPEFAPNTFAGAYHPAAAAGGRRRVILFPDTFNNFFRPQTANAAAQVLEAAGYSVALPGRDVCCARPLFAWGMLDGARRQLARLLDVLAPQIADGTPVVGLEPACVATFHDELCELFPGDERARRLRDQSFLLEFLLHEADWQPPPLAGKAVVHPHCYQHAVFGVEPQRKMLERLGLEVKVLDSGCCGMAGSFGFETEHYDVSMRCAERVLLPAVRKTPEDTYLIADGFACREQIVQATGRNPHHLAEILRHAVQEAKMR